MMSNDITAPETKSSVSRLSPEAAAAVLVSASPIPIGRPGRTTATSLGGIDLQGVDITVRIASKTVVLALSTSCDGCRELAAVVADGIDGFEVLGLLRAPKDKASQ